MSLASERVRQPARPVISLLQRFLPLPQDYTHVAIFFQNNPWVKYRRQNLGKGVNLAAANSLKYLPPQTDRLTRCLSLAYLSCHVPQGTRLPAHIGNHKLAFTMYLTVLK